MTVVAERRAVQGALSGAVELMRLILRRDRYLFPAWIVIMALLPAGLAGGSATAYPTEADRVALATDVAANPTLLATRGPVFAPTPGGLVAQGFVASGILLAGIVSVVLVVRYTRADEQAGRRELLGSAVVGRHAALAAALGVVAAANLAIAILVALVLTATGLPVTGSVALGSALAAGGIVFAAVGAVAAQLAESSGAARGLGLLVVAVLFVVAGVGEVARTGLVWASPFGWARRVQAYAGEQWGVLLLFVALAAALVLGAFALSARRDVGAGLLAARSGPAHAAPSLRSPVALAWRLHRGAIGMWTVGFVLLGALLGTAMRSIGSLLDTPAFRAVATALGGGDVAEVFFRFVLYVLSQVIAACAVAAVLRMRAEETGGRVDVLLSGPVSRIRWAQGHLVVTAAGTAVVLVGLGLGAGIGYDAPLAVLGMTLAYLPACLAFAGLGIALIGWVPRFAAAVTWTVLGLVIATDFLGEFRLVDPAMLRWVSPFVATIIPLTTGTGLAAALLSITGIAAGLSVIGLVGVRRRDLDAT